MKRATEGMTGREMLRYYERMRDYSYANVILLARENYGDEKAYAMLEEAERNGNRLYAYCHPEDLKRGCVDGGFLFKVVSIEEYNSLMSD